MASDTLTIIINAKDNASGPLSKVNKKLGGMGKIAGIAGKAVAGGLAAAGVAAVGLGALSLKMAGDFDAATKALIVGTGASGDALKAMQDDVMAIVNSSAGLGHSMEEVGSTIAEVATRTGATGDALQGLSSDILQMTRLTGGDAVQATQKITRVMGDWGVSVEDSRDLVNDLFAAGQTFGIGLDSLAGKLVQFGAPLRQMGFSLEESTAMLGKWEKEGVNTELVIGSLRIAAGHFAKEQVPLKEGLQDTIEAIKNAATESDGLAIAMEVFGARAGPDMAAAIREGRFELDDAIGSLQGMDGALKDAALRSMTLGDKWDLLKRQAGNALIPIGKEYLQPLMNKLLTLASNTLPVVITSMTNFTGKASEAFGEFKMAFHDAMESGSDSIDSFLWALETFAYDLFDIDLDSFTNGLSDVIHGFLDLGDAISAGNWPAVGDMLSGWASAGVAWMRETAGNLWNQLVTWWDDIGSAWASSIVSKVGSFLVGLAWDIGDAATGLWNQLITWWDNSGAEWASNAVSKISSFLGGIAWDIRSAAKNLWMNLADWWTNGGQELTDSTVASIRDWLSGIVWDIGDSAQNLWTKFAAWWDTSDASAISANIAQKMMTQIDTALNETIPATEFTFGEALGEQFAKTIKSAISWLVNSLSDEDLMKTLTMALNPMNVGLYLGNLIGDNIGSGLSKGFSDGSFFTGVGSAFWQGFFEGIRKEAPALGTLVDILQLADKLNLGSSAANIGFATGMEIINGIKDSSSESQSDIESIGSDIVSGVGVGIDSEKTGLGAAFESALNGAINAAKDFLQSHSPSQKTANEIGVPVVEGVIVGMNSMLGAANAAALAIGHAITAGMVIGIMSRAAAIAAAAAKVVRDAIAAARAAADSHSPSREFMRIGIDIILGLIKGIEDMDDDAAKAMAQVVNSVIRAAQGLLDFYFDLAEFEIPDSNYQDAIDWLASLAGRLSQAVTSLQDWKIDFGDDFKAFAANLKAGFAPLLEALKFVEKMQSFKWLKPGTGVPIIQWLASFAGYVAQEMTRIKAWKNIDFGDAFKEFSDNLKKGFGPLIEALKLVEKMQSFQWLKPGTAVPVIKWLASFSGIMAQEMTRISKWGGIDFGEGFKRFTDGIKEGFGAMSDALKFTEELGMWKHAKGLRGKFTQFRKDLEFIIQEFGKSARKLKGMVDDDMAQFAKTMSDIAGGLIDAVDLLKTDWTKVTVPPASLWAPLFDWIMQVMTEAARYATEEIKPEALDAASKFGGAIGALIGGLSDALSFITDLMQTPGSVFGDADKFADVMGMLLQRIDGTIKAFKAYIVDKEGDEWLDAADAFLNVLNEVIGTLSSALRLFTDLGSADMPSLSEIDQFVSAIIAIFAQLGESVTQSAGMIRVAVGDIKTQLGGGHMEGGMHAVAFNSTITVRHEVSVTSPDGSVDQIDMETLANELKDYIGYGY